MRIANQVANEARNLLNCSESSVFGFELMVVGKYPALAESNTAARQHVNSVIWAIVDVRKQVRDLIALERQRIFTKVRNDMVWLFIDPTERSHDPAIAKGLEEFALLSRALDPAATPELTNHAVNNLTLMFADQLVTAGFAVWKSGWDHKKLQETMRAWQSAINSSRLENILGKEQVGKTLG